MTCRCENDRLRNNTGATFSSWEEDVAKLCCLLLLNGNRISQQHFMLEDLAYYDDGIDGRRGHERATRTASPSAQARTGAEILGSLSARARSLFRAGRR